MMISRTLRFVFMLLTLSLAACTVTVVDQTPHRAPQAVADFTLRYKPERNNRGAPHRGDIVIACTTVQAVYDLLDTGRAGRGCGPRAVTYWSPRSPYRAGDGRLYTIGQHSEAGWPYYSAVRGHVDGRSRRHYY